jgi:hypothetical protein
MSHRERWHNLPCASSCKSYSLGSWIISSKKTMFNVLFSSTIETILVFNKREKRGDTLIKTGWQYWDEISFISKNQKIAYNLKITRGFHRKCSIFFYIIWCVIEFCANFIKIPSIHLDILVIEVTRERGGSIDSKSPPTNDFLKYTN